MVSRDFYLLWVIPVGMPNWVKQKRVYEDPPALNRERFRAAEVAEQYFLRQAEEAEFRGDLEGKEEAELFAEQMAQAKVFANSCFQEQMIGAYPLPENKTPVDSGNRSKDK